MAATAVERQTLLESPVDADASSKEDSRERSGRSRAYMLAVACTVACGAFLTCRVWSRQRLLRRDTLKPGIDLEEVQDSPSWGCGLVGELPGIWRSGNQIQVSSEMRRFIDKVKLSSDYNRVTYWAWSLWPNDQALSEDFVFMPENWGAGPVDPNGVPSAGQLAKGVRMAHIMLGMNEPDIAGSCMDHGMFGKCVAPCDEQDLAAQDCPHRPPLWVKVPEAATKPEPAAWEEGLCRRYKSRQEGDSSEGVNMSKEAAETEIDLAPANARGHCKCTGASSSGFQSIDGCRDHQPLPRLFKAPHDMPCVKKVMGDWKQMAGVAAAKGYNYLSTPLISQGMSYARAFIETACDCDEHHDCSCTSVSCGCPTHVAFHWYAFDCRPSSTRSYEDLQDKLADVSDLMMDFPFVQGAIINEVGILNCAPTNHNMTASEANEGAPNMRPPPMTASESEESLFTTTTTKEEPPHPEKGCVPNTGLFPAKCLEGHRCPPNAELPKGMVSFMDELFEILINAKTPDNRSVVKGFSWFNMNGDGGTYDLQLFHKDGSVNEVGEAYMRNCEKWGNGRRFAR